MNDSLGSEADSVGGTRGKEPLTRFINLMYILTQFVKDVS